MRHRRQGRKLGRNPNHQRALLRSLASALFLTERDAEGEDNKPKVKGRIITTIQKAKEVRPLVERCITIARHALPHQEAADELEPERRTPQRAVAGLAAQRPLAGVEPGDRPGGGRPPPRLRLLGDKQAVRILFEEIAPRFADRAGGYTRVLAAGQAPAGRRRHPGDSGIGRQERPRPPKRPPGPRSIPT